MSAVGRITPVKRRAVREKDGSIRFLDDDEHPGDFRGSFSEPPRKSPDAFKNPGHHLEDRVQSIMKWEGFRNVEINRIIRDSDGHISEIDVIASGGRLFSRWFPSRWSPLRVGQGTAYVECKRYAADHPVSLADVAKFKEVGIMNNLPRRNMLVVTTSSYVPRARKIGVRTVDGKALRRWERGAWRSYRQRRVRRLGVAAAAVAVAGVVGWGASVARDLRRQRADAAPEAKASLFTRRLWEAVGGTPPPRRAFVVLPHTDSLALGRGGASTVSPGPTLGVVVSLHNPNAPVTAAGAHSPSDDHQRDFLAQTSSFEAAWERPLRVATDAIKDSPPGRAAQMVLEPSAADIEHRERRLAAGEESALDVAVTTACNGAVKAAGAVRDALSWVLRPTNGMREWFWRHNDALELVWVPPACVLDRPHPSVGMRCPSWVPDDAAEKWARMKPSDASAARPVRLFRLPIPHILSVPAFKSVQHPPGTKR